MIASWQHAERSTSSLTSILLAAISTSKTLIENLRFTQHLNTSKDVHGPTGCYVAHIDMPRSDVEAFRHL